MFKRCSRCYHVDIDGNLCSNLGGSSQNLVDFHAARLSVEAEDLGRRPCCCRVRQIYPWGYTVKASGSKRLIPP
jgi:hypothetical protein